MPNPASRLMRLRVVPDEGHGAADHARNDNRAARIVEVMEREGIVGPADGARPRKVLVPPIEG